MGDYNIDLLKVNLNYTSKLLNILSCYAFHPHINNPTRIYCTSETFLDNIFSNSSDYPFINGILYYDISDHLPIFAICNKPKYFHSQRTNTHIYKRKETKTNIILLNQNLQNEFWEDVYNEYDANKAFDIYFFKIS